MYNLNRVKFLSWLMTIDSSFFTSCAIAALDEDGEFSISIEEIVNKIGEVPAFSIEGMIDASHINIDGHVSSKLISIEKIKEESKIFAYIVNNSSLKPTAIVYNGEDENSEVLLNGVIENSGNVQESLMELVLAHIPKNESCKIILKNIGII